MVSASPLGLSDASLYIQTGLLGGELSHGCSKSTFSVTNPSTGAVLGSCPDMTVEDARTAINIAHEAFKSFKTATPVERAELLARYHALVLENAGDIARLITLENGKAYSDALGEVKYAASYFQWYSGEALRCTGQTIQSSLPGVRNFTVKEPIGVCGLLLPWNFPVAMVARKLGPILAVGATCVIKPPSETPLSINALVELARRAGVPAGVINVVHTEKNLISIGRELCTNPKVKKISFTGSTRVGKLLMEQCSSTLKKMSMELGGNAPFIIFGDANINAAVAGVLASKFRTSGQTCVCANRIFVHSSIYDQFSKLLCDKVKQYKLGDGLDEGVTHGPLIAERAANKVQEHVDDAVARGARILVGGQKLHGSFYPPTLLVDVPVDCLISDEETFGPLAALMRFESEDEVIGYANNTSVGLAGYFFSENPDRIWRVADALNVGMVGANQGIISQAQVPFGGIGESGWGKEGGSEGTLEFCKTKLVCIGTTGGY